MVHVPRRIPIDEDAFRRRRAAFADYLRGRRKALTGRRVAVLDLLLRAQNHLSAEEVRAALGESSGSLAEVASTLDLLVDAGLAGSVTGAGGEKRFEAKLDRPHHDHLICVHCRRIIEVEWPEIERMQASACRELGFEIQFHRHEVFGRCADCREKNP